MRLFRGETGRRKKRCALLWQGDGVQGLKPDPLFFVAVVARLKPCPVTKQEA
jgi:hypothetical protein